MRLTFAAGSPYQIEGIWFAKDMESLDRPERRELVKTDREPSRLVGRLEAARPCAQAIVEVHTFDDMEYIRSPRLSCVFFLRFEMYTRGRFYRCARSVIVKLSEPLRLHVVILDTTNKADCTKNGVPLDQRRQWQAWQC